MEILGQGNITYLYVNGLRVDKAIKLSDHIELLPARCDFRSDDIIDVMKTEIEIGVAAIFLRNVRSQIRIQADSPKELAIRAWNSQWDVILLSAIFHREAICNLQCDVPAEKFDAKSSLHVTNYQLRGFSPNEPEALSDEDAKWIETNFRQARELLGVSKFQSAVHCLSTYRWHSMPRVQLAVIWAGIEGLFGIESEIVFRLSLYVARYLEPTDPARQKEVFAHVKKMYKQRSAAVHGAELKGDGHDAVADAAQLLLQLVKKCAVSNGLPNVDQLAP